MSAKVAYKLLSGPIFSHASDDAILWQYGFRSGDADRPRGLDRGVLRRVHVGGCVSVRGGVYAHGLNTGYGVVVDGGNNAFVTGA